MAHDTGIDRDGFWRCSGCQRLVPNIALTHQCPSTGAKHHAPHGERPPMVVNAPMVALLPSPVPPTIYLAGPMTGIAEFNAPAFAKYAEKYRAKGFAVVSPPEMDAGDYHQPYTTYIRRDVTRLLQGDIEAVYLLPGWENSKGARLEKHLAEVMGLRVCDAETGEPLVEETKVNPDPRVQTMPSESAERKGVPLCSGVLDYFPAALAAVARLSKYGNDKHNPGEPLHWARGKSADHADCILRHLADRGIMDNETGLSHTVEVAWRALALLQEEEETRGAARPRGAY